MDMKHQQVKLSEQRSGGLPCGRVSQAPSRSVKAVLALVWLGLLFFGPVVAGSVHADTRYVTDMLILSLREGPGNEYQVINTLRSDAPVDVLEEQDGYMKIRTAEGQEGWVAKQYITTNTPKPVIIAALNKKVNRLEAKIEQLEQTSTSAQGRLASEQHDCGQRIKELEKMLHKWEEKALSTKKELNATTQKHNRFLAASKNVAALVGERDSLKVTNADLQVANDNLKTQMEQLQQDNDRLVRKEILQWFLAGSGVFFVGLLIGKVSRKKKPY